MVKDITPSELQARLAAPEAPAVLDVREPWELEIARLPGTQNIPMNELPPRLSELDPNRELVVMCRSGGRSMQVAQFLDRQGFRSVANLKGGILGWSQDVDPNIQQY
jgi:adenylyltransferase/sulfurtransferase